MKHAAILFSARSEAAFATILPPNECPIRTSSACSFSVFFLMNSATLSAKASAFSIT